MTGAFTTGAFTVAGSAVGGLASWAVAATQVRERRQSVRQDRLARLSDRRQDAYADFIKCGDTLSDCLRDLYSHKRHEDVPAELKRRYAQAWNEQLSSCAAVEVVGPVEVANAARKLQDAVADLCNRIDPWLAGKQWGAADDDGFDAATKTRKDARRAFLEAARGVVGTA